jgi:hypothetical protein
MQWGDTPRADMLVAVVGRDAEVGITGVRDRYETCDGYHGNGCPGFGVPYVGV